MSTAKPSNDPANPPQRTRASNAREWLVSVRDLDEARLAAEFEVDILDLKEPLHGALSPVSDTLWRHIGRWAAAQTSNDGKADLRLSAALGEWEQATEIAGSVPPEFAFAKMGPGGCNSESQLQDHWGTVRRRLPRPVELVAVAYADHAAADCLSAESILDLADRQGFARILLDTFQKQEGSTIDIWGGDRLVQFGADAHRRGLWWALAGSLTLSECDLIDQWQPSLCWRPNCYAVRGDVCERSRTGTLSPARLRAWESMLVST